MSVSQFKSAIECEASVIAELKGEHERPSSLALTVGSYTHSAFESEQVLTSLWKKTEALFSIREVGNTLILSKLIP